MIPDVGDTVQLPLLISLPRSAHSNQTRRQGILDRRSENVEQLTTISPLSWQYRQFQAKT